jgi:hypothetical protein
VLRDVTVRKRFEQRQQFLAEAGEKLASAFGSSETLNQVARLAVPTMADGCILESRVGNGFLAGAAAHVDPAIEEMLDEIGLEGTRVPPRGIRHRDSRFLSNAVAFQAARLGRHQPRYIRAVTAMNPHSFFRSLRASSLSVAPFSTSRG